MASNENDVKSVILGGEIDIRLLKEEFPLIPAVANPEATLLDHNYYLSPNMIVQEKEKDLNTKSIVKRNRKITTITHLFSCNICGYTTIKKDVFAKHQEVHGRIVTGTIYVPCSSCNVKSEPTDRHKCPHCNFTAKSQQSVKVHMHIHKSNTAYKCTECPYYGKNFKELIAHFRTSIRYSCKYCRFSSHIRENFLKHQKMKNKCKM